MIKVGIVGGTGYTGVELMRLLAAKAHAGTTVRIILGDPESPDYAGIVCCLQRGEAEGLHALIEKLSVGSVDG